jgi:hypothetical protein
MEITPKEGPDRGNNHYEARARMPRLSAPRISLRSRVLCGKNPFFRCDLRALCGKRVTPRQPLNIDARIYLCREPYPKLCHLDRFRGNL